MSAAVRVLLPAAALALLAGCSSGPPAADAAVPDGLGPPVTDPQVVVADNHFEPAEVVIEAGSTVRWVWEGRAAHDVVGEGFDSGVQVEGGFTHTFTSGGTYPYVCRLHPGMEGTVYVLPAG